MNKRGYGHFIICEKITVLLFITCQELICPFETENGIKSRCYKMVMASINCIFILFLMSSNNVKKMKSGQSITL